MTRISHDATKTIRNLSATRARRGYVAMRKAGVSEFDSSIFRELLRAGLVRQTASGWFMRI